MKKKSGPSSEVALLTQKQFDFKKGMRDRSKMVVTIVNNLVIGIEIIRKENLTYYKSKK